MGFAFQNDIIQDYFSEIRKILYKEDGRRDKPPKDLIDFRKVNIEQIDYGTYEDPNEKSKITVTPNYSLLELGPQVIDDTVIEHTIPFYNESFIKLPLDVVSKSNTVELDFFFYRYSALGKMNNSDSPMARSIVIQNYAMRRSDFLYMMLVTKFDNMDSRYRLCIKESKKHFQFQKKTEEDIILQHLIKYYSGILASDEMQLNLFSHVKINKKLADLYTRILIEFFTLKLNTLMPEIDKYYTTPMIDKEMERRSDDIPIIELPADFSLTENEVKSPELDIRQTAILFYYLRKHGATINYTDKSFSKLVHYISGHSPDNLRKRSGFGNINEVSRETRDGIPYSNLKNVITLLEKIIADINKAIKE